MTLAGGDFKFREGGAGAGVRWGMEGIGGDRKFKLVARRMGVSGVVVGGGDIRLRSCSD